MGIFLWPLGEDLVVSDPCPSGLPEIWTVCRIKIAIQQNNDDNNHTNNNRHTIN